MEHEESEEECEEGEAERMSVSRCFVFPGNLYFEKAGEFLSFKSSLSLFGVSGETDSKVHSKKAKENNSRKTKGEKAPFSSCMPSLDSALNIIPPQAGTEKTKNTASYPLAFYESERRFFA